MIKADRLKTDLQKRLPVLEKALREQAEDRGLRYAAELHAEWRRAKDAGRIAATYEEWRGDQVTQAAVAWLLAMVFLRFCEDNGLIDEPYITGPGDRAAEAIERQHAFFASEEHREESDREWVLAGIQALCDARDTTDNVMRRLFDPAHNPMWLIDPPADAITDLLRFWRERDANGDLIHDFEDKDWNTRFLGDLYQDLSEHAKKQYALLQTPEFVEEFILDRTLKPAIDEFGLKPENVRLTGERIPDGLRVIDPTCGSGHFLLGAFHRILAEQRRRGDSRDINERISDALQSVHGVDKNPFAVAIARFRLVLAAMRAEEKYRLADASHFEINVAVGDSLLHGRGAVGVTDDLFEERDLFYFRTEDVRDYMESCDMLGVNSYHVVVGNPPYITVDDEQERKNYRKAYASCSGNYPLSVPFAERLFKLARTAGAGRRDAGFTGQITANTFMRRKSGKKLIEEFFQAKAHLSEVIDTSGAYIPDHGIPTVILVGRYYVPNMDQTVRAVLGVRDEPGVPQVPANGHVWSSIAEHIDQPGYEDDWISVVDLPRIRLRKHPWSLGGGGASELRQHLEDSDRATVGDLVAETGSGAVTREDDAYMVGWGYLERRGIDEKFRKPMVEGSAERDWRITSPGYAIWPYNPSTLAAETDENVIRSLWPNRVYLRRRKAYGKTQAERRLSWFEYSMFFRTRYRPSLVLAMPTVSTHVHCVLDKDNFVFKDTSLLLTLKADVDDEQNLLLLGALNSSVACFWFRQVSQPKSGSGIGRGVQDESWENRYQFTGENLRKFPLPSGLPLERPRELDELARRLAACEPSAIAGRGTPTSEALAKAESDYTSTRTRMIALQEELDWDVYRRYGLLDEDEAAELISSPGDVPEINLGERAFEILLARSGATTEWFSRHGSKRTVDLPARWPEAYQRVVEARIKMIGKRPKTIGLIERPEYKRRWLDDLWDEKVKTALRSWLLDRCEDRDLWFDANDEPEPMTVNRLADKLRDHADVVAVAGLYAGTDADLAKVIADITAAEHVPYLATLRYKQSGLSKRGQWLRVWERQREEDRLNAEARAQAELRGEEMPVDKWLDIDPPERYDSADFVKFEYWRNRGQLDVPKERFISYPDAGPPGDRSLLLGWAGWDDAQRAQALIGLADDRVRDDAGRAVIGPIVAGLAEVMPWVEQWHSERDALGTSPASDYAAVLAELRATYGTGEDSSG